MIINLSEPSPTQDQAHPADPTPRHLIRRGEMCPRCGEGRLDYNGMLDLECPACGYSESAGGGCT